MPIDPQIGTRIKEIRERNHFTREELAENAEISSKFLYEIEMNHRGFSAMNLLKISKALGVSTDYILTGAKEADGNRDLIHIIESFDASQISQVKRILLIMLELSRF